MPPAAVSPRHIRDHATTESQCSMEVDVDDPPPPHAADPQQQQHQHPHTHHHPPPSKRRRMHTDVLGCCHRAVAAYLSDGGSTCTAASSLSRATWRSSGGNTDHTQPRRNRVKKRQAKSRIVLATQARRGVGAEGLAPVEYVRPHRSRACRSVSPKTFRRAHHTFILNSCSSREAPRGRSCGYEADESGVEC